MFLHSNIFGKHYGQSNATFTNATVQADYVAFKNDINNKINAMQTRPSFDGTTVTIDAGESKVLTDSNGVLADYSSIDNTKDNVRFQHNKGENTLTITVSENCNVERLNISDNTFKDWGMIKEESKDQDTTVYFSFTSGVQNQLMALHYNDPVPMAMSLQINLTGKLELTKLDESDNLIDGAVFNITGPNGYNQDVTVTNGRILVENLKKGTYTIKEKSAPTGYLLNTQSYNVEIRTNETTTQVVKNGEPTGKILVYKVSENNDKIEGAVFKVTAAEKITNKAGTKTYYNKGDEVARITTVKGTGIAEIDNLPLGKYFVNEISTPTGYLLNATTFIANLEYVNDTTPVVTIKVGNVLNAEPRGKIIVNKGSNNHDPITGAVFEVIANDSITNVEKTKKYYNKGDLVAEITTKDGVAILDNIPLGKYIVREKTAPKGYLRNKTEYPVTLSYKDDSTAKIEVEIPAVLDDEPTGVIEIHKRDKETETVPQGDAVFLNAEYKVYADEDIYNVAKSLKYYSKNDVVATLYMDKNGDAKVSDLPMGKYYVKETKQPDGYFIDEETYRVTLSYLDQETPVIYASVVSHEQVKKQRIHVFKSGIDVNSDVTPGLEGSKFTIKLDKDVKQALAKGYTYEEIWGGVDKLGNQVTVDNSRMKKAQEIAPTYEVITTDNEGNAYTQKALPYGKYIMKETYTPEDYESVADITFRITQDESEILEIAKKVKTIVANDEQLETYIRLIKKDLKTGKNVTLNSATFQIIPTEDIYDRATKVILHQKGKPVMQKIGSTTYNSFTTNADNLIIPKQSYNNNTTDGKGTTTLPLKLEVGSYKITEIQLPEGFLVLDEPVYFDVENIRGNDQDEDGDFIQEVIIKNEQPTGKIELDKFIALRENVDTSLVDTSDLSNIQFTLTASENIIDMADGSTIYKEGQIIGVYTLDKNGYLTIDEIPMGKYYLQEIKTMDGLILNRNKFEIEFIKQDDTTKVYEKVQKVTNDTTLIEISKTDITGDKELEGAKLTVIDSEGNTIDSWTSTNNSHKIEGLTVGKTYTLREEIAPNGYVRASEIQFTVKDTAETQKVTMVDKVVDMTKLNITGDEVEGAKMQVFDKEGNLVDEWISTKEAHKINNLVEGEKYTLHEENAPEGYVLATDIEFEVTFDKETQHENMVDKIVEMSKVDISGEEIEGATIQVKDKDNKVIDEWVSGKKPHKINNLKEGETYTLHEEISAKGYVKANDITFTVSLDKETQHEEMIDKIVEMTKENIDGEILEGAEMKVYDKEGNIIDEWTSTKEAHRIENLIEGETYTLHEESVPEGYVKAKDETFEVTYDKENQIVVMIDKIVEMSKVDVAGEEIEGATIQVLDKEGNIIDEWVSGKEPHKINNLVEGESYILHEEIAVDGYVKASDIEFEVTFDKETQHEKMIDKIVEMSKVDVAGKEIEGATIQVLDKEGNIIDEWVSGKEPHKINNLVEGESYILHEEIVVDGYVKATDIEFEVTMEKENQKITMIDKIVSVTKTDLTDGTEVEGAELTVTDEDGNVIDKWTSTKEPHQIVGLEEGKKYILTEITAPYGYEIAESIEFEVSLEKENQLIEMKDMPILKSVRVEKLDIDTKEHIKSNKFVFGIYEDAECTKLIREAGANEYEGTALFENLKYGTYYIKEVQAPLGYKLSDQVVKIEINDKGVFADGISLEEKDNIYSFEYYNSLIPKIQTGNETNYILLGSLAIISLVGIVGGIILLRRKNNEK